MASGQLAGDLVGGGLGASGRQVSSQDAVCEFSFHSRIIVVKNEDATPLFFFTLDFSKKCVSFNDRHQCGARRSFDSVQGSSSEILTDYHLVAIRQFAYEIINSHELY